MEKDRRQVRSLRQSSAYRWVFAVVGPKGGDDAVEVVCWQKRAAAANNWWREGRGLRPVENMIRSFGAPAFDPSNACNNRASIVPGNAPTCPKVSNPPLPGNGQLRADQPLIPFDATMPSKGWGTTGP